MSAKPPSWVLLGSSDALRMSSVWVSPKVLGFHPPPFNHVLLVSALCASCSTSQGSWLLPLDARHPSQLCADLHRAARPWLHPHPCRVDMGTRPTAHPWVRRGMPSSQLPSHPQSLYLHVYLLHTYYVLCAQHGSRQTCLASPEFHLTQKSLIRTPPPQ